MIELISYRDQRILRISELLILNSHVITIKELMLANKSSLKTVYDDLNYLKSEFNHILELDIQNGSVFSNATSLGDLMTIRKLIFFKNLAIRIYLFLYFKGRTSIEELSNEFEYSKSKIRNEIKNINNVLKDIRISINLNEGAYYLQSDDQARLSYLASMMVLGSGYPKYIYDCKDEYIEKSKFEEIRKINIPSVIREEILLADIFYNEYSQKFACTNYYYYVPSAILDDINNRLRNYYVFDEETIFIVENIINSLYFKMKIFNLKSVFRMKRYEYFYHLFSIENYFVVSEYEKNIIELEKRWGISFNDYKEELLFLIYIHHPRINEHKKYNIGIYSDLGHAHAIMLHERLEKHFNKHNFEVFELEKSYDLILSTAKNSIDFKNDNVLSVSDFLTPDDYRNLYHALYIENQN